MEEHRLKEMPMDYDSELFNSLLKDTEKLRNKLAYGIDHRRFGVEHEDIVSGFNTRCIYCFTKYYPEKNNPEELKAYIINSLSMFKSRILRNAYSVKSQARSSTVDIQELYNYDDLLVEEEKQEDERVYKVKIFFKSRLTKPAYDLWLAQIYPPDWIIDQLIDTPKQIHRVPKEILADYFDISVEQVEKLRKEIRSITKQAKVEFSLYASSLN